MMIRPSCPEHHDLALDLAQGLLDDAAAAEAEAVRRTCPVCRAWWSEQLEGEAAAVVDAAVAAILTDLKLPRRRRRHPWMAAAAAAAMALGAAGLWMARGPEPAVPAPGERLAAIGTLDFEAPGMLPRLVVVAEDAQQTDHERVVEIAPPSDRGGAAPAVDDEARIAAVTTSGSVVESAPEPLFVGDFETGNLGAWVPET